MFPKACKCGAIKTDGPPQYCEKCNTFTHPAYVGREASKEGAKAEG